MKQPFFIGIIACLCISSCGILNTHNVSNHFLWKNRILEQDLSIQFKFEPEIIRDFTGAYTYFLADFFQDSLDLHTLKKSLHQKLEQRNFTINDTLDKPSIEVESILFKEREAFVAVNSNDQEEYLGDYESYTVKLQIKGFLKLDHQTAPIICDYEFVAEPREGFVFKNMMTYSNRFVRIDRILDNLLNQFSHEAYKLTKEWLNSK